MFCQSGGGRWKAEGQQLAGTEISAFEMCYQPWRGGRNCDGARSMVAVLNNVISLGTVALQVGFRKPELPDLLRTPR